MPTINQATFDFMNPKVMWWSWREAHQRALSCGCRLTLTALQGIVAQVASGELSREMGKNLIMTAFPAISPEHADTLVGPVAEMKEHGDPDNPEEAPPAESEEEGRRPPDTAGAPPERGNPGAVRKETAPAGVRIDQKAPGKRGAMVREPDDRTAVV